MRAVALVALAASALAGCKLSSDAVAVVDAMPAPDAPIIEPDAPIDAAPDVGCSGVDRDVIFYLSMNRPAGASWPDLTGNHDARTVGGDGGTVTGPSSECQTAYATSGGQHMVVDDASEFDLGEGSIDFYVQVPEPGVFRGILGRDASGQLLAGHLGVFFDENNQVMVRIQNTVDEVYHCSAAQVAGEWIFVGINIGPPNIELYVDGVLAEEATAEDGTTTCGTPFSGGIAGNDNPWLIGHNAGTSDEGSATPISAPLDTAIDDIRLSRIRRGY